MLHFLCSEYQEMVGKVYLTQKKIPDTNNVFGTVVNAIKKHRAHPSILNMKERRITIWSLFEISLLKK